MRNIRSSLRRRRNTRMRAFDALPPALRRWLHQAALPWSADSALRIWRAAPSEVDALHRLSAIEARLIAQDAGRIWGADHPAATSIPVLQPSHFRARSGARG